MIDFVPHSAARADAAGAGDGVAVRARPSPGAMSPDPAPSVEPRAAAGTSPCRRLPRFRLPRRADLHAPRGSGEPSARTARLASSADRRRTLVRGGGRALRRTAPVDVGRGAVELWSTSRSRRAGVSASALGVAAALLLLGSWRSRRFPARPRAATRCPPADDAIHLVPEDALAYVHVNVDPGHRAVPGGGQGWPSRAAVAHRSRRSGACLRGCPGRRAPPDFERDVAALVRGRGGARRSCPPAAARRGGRAARGRATRPARSSSPTRSRPGTPRRRPRTATRGAGRSPRAGDGAVGGFLAIGTRERRPRRDRRRQRGEGDGLAGRRSATRARRAAPCPTSASPTPISPRTGSRGWSPTRAGRSRRSRSVVDPGASRGSRGGAGGERRRARAGRSLRARSRPGQGPPRLLLGLPAVRAQPRRLAARATRSATSGFGDPGTTLRSLLGAGERRGAGAGGGGRRPAQAGEGPRRRRPGEGPPAARSAARRRSRSSPRRATPAGPRAAARRRAIAAAAREAPFLVFLAGGRRRRRGRARRWPASRTRSPKALDPSSGPRRPSFSEHKVGDVTAHSLRALADGRPHLRDRRARRSSSPRDPAGVEQVVRGKGGLDAEDLYGGRPTGFPASVSMLAYLNLGGLVALAESSGLAEDPAYATFAAEVRKLRRSAWRSDRARERALHGRPPGRRRGPRRRRRRRCGRSADRVDDGDAQPPVRYSRGQRMTIEDLLRERVPVHLRVGHRGPPGQDLRPDLRRRPRRGDRPTTRPGASPASASSTPASSSSPARSRTETYVDIPQIVRARRCTGSATTAPSTGSTPTPAR